MTVDINNLNPFLLAALWVTAAVCTVLVIAGLIGLWRVYVKGGERGWKVLIPLLNDHALYKITWSKSVFWADLLLSLAGAVLMGLSGGNLLIRYAQALSAAGVEIPDFGPYLIGPGTALPSWCCLVAFVLLTAAGLIRLVRTYKLSTAFDHGFGFFLGLLFFPLIFVMILGFGRQYYVGPNRTVRVENMENIR